MLLYTPPPPMYGEPSSPAMSYNSMYATSDPHFSTTEPPFARLGTPTSSTCMSTQDSNEVWENN